MRYACYEEDRTGEWIRTDTIRQFVITQRRYGDNRLDVVRRTDSLDILRREVRRLRNKAGGDFNIRGWKLNRHNNSAHRVVGA